MFLDNFLRDPALSKKFLAINYIASKLVTIVWPEGVKKLPSTSVLDCGQVKSGIGKKKYCHNITQLLKREM